MMYLVMDEKRLRTWVPPATVVNPKTKVARDATLEEHLSKVGNAGWRLHSVVGPWWKREYIFEK